MALVEAGRKKGMDRKHLAGTHITGRFMVALAIGCVLGAATGCGGLDGTDDLGDDAREDVGDAAEALGTQTETEPNDSAASVNVKAMTMRDDNYGAFPAGDTVDYWKFTLSTRMYVNLYLGNIPVGGDYDMAVYASNDLVHPVWTGTAGGSAPEIGNNVNLQGGTYQVKVYVYSGPRGDVSYQLRYSSTSVSRGYQWVDAHVPYCGGVNGGPDILCGGTCTRTGAAANPAWDPYRSDCSGFVSWAWGLASPGLVTGTLPTVSTPVTVSSLAAGDMLLGAGHVVLFDTWTDKATGKARVLHENHCGTVAVAADVTLPIVAGSTTTTLWGAAYKAYRYNMP